MRISLCPICSKQIRKGQDIAVIAFPIKSLSDDGDYDVIKDFVEHENVVHNKCLSNTALKLVNVLSGKEQSVDNPVIEERVSAQAMQGSQPSSLVKDFQDALSAIGENVTQGQVHMFLMKNPSKREIGQLLPLWLEQRCKFE